MKSASIQAGSFRRSEAGMALVIVMIAVFVLTILAGGFAYSMKVETRLARNSSCETELEWLGRSAVEKAKWILAEQLKIAQERYDAHNQVWAGGQGGLGTSNSPLVGVELAVQSKNGSATFKITDLESKANINMADETILQQALMVMGVDAGEMTPVVNSILDWIDDDKRARIQSKEFIGANPYAYGERAARIYKLLNKNNDYWSLFLFLL